MITNTEFLAVLAIAIFLAVITSILTAMRQAEKEAIDRNKSKKILVGKDDSPRFEVECFEDYNYDLVL